MEQNNQNVQAPPEPMSQELMLQEILENSRKTRKYMQWQLYITVILIVLPILAMAIAIPMMIKSLGTLGSIYGGVLQ